MAQSAKKVAFSIPTRFDGNRFTVTAEQSHPSQMDRYNRLTERGLIDAVTLPDLPLIGRLRELPALLRGMDTGLDPLSSLENTTLPVMTVSAGGRTQSKISERLLAGAEGGACAFLILSGGGVSRRMLRSVPFGERFLPSDAFSILRCLNDLRRSGRIPADIPAWAVENPMIGRVATQIDRLARKIDSGAEAIFTQPPLLWSRFESWWEAASKRGLTQTPIVVGIPVLRSARMLKFWHYLVGVGTGAPESSRMIHEFREAERGMDQEDYARFRSEWTIEWIRKVRTLPGVAGIHLMPIGGSQGLEDILTASDLNAHQRARSDVQATIGDLAKRDIPIVNEPGLLDDRYVRGFRRNLDAFSDAAKKTGTRFSVYWNRIAYRQHFRQPIARRPFIDAESEEERAWEVAIDLQQWRTTASLTRALEQTLPAFAQGQPESKDGIIIGGFVPYSQSIVWQFNTCFWNSVIDYVSALGRDYRDSIKGSPDSDPHFVRRSAERFLDEVSETRASGDQSPLAYVEIGVASVDYARTFIDAFARSANARGIDVGEITYVLTDTSEAVLDQAVSELGETRQGVRLDYVRSNVEKPLEGLGPYQGSVQRIHVTNVFDNLPGDKLAQIGDRKYLVETRLYLPREAFLRLTSDYGLPTATLESDLEEIAVTGVEPFLRTYRSRFSDQLGEGKGDRQFFRFWQDLYGNPADRSTGLKLEERYKRIEDLKSFRFLHTDRLPGRIDPAAILQEVLDEYPKNVWMHLSNRAVEGGLQLISLLRSGGVLEIVDIIVRRISDYHNVPQRRTKKGKRIYRMGFKGPAKYDGSAVDWLNGRLLEAAALAAYPGCSVTYEPLDDVGKPQMTRMEIRRD